MPLLIIDHADPANDSAASESRRTAYVIGFEESRARITGKTNSEGKSTGARITPDIFETLARHRLLGRDMVKVLLDQEPEALPTSNVVVSVLKSFRGDSTDVMNTAFRISSEFLETLTSDGRVDADSLKLMLEHDEKLRVSQASLNDCLEDGLTDCVELILGNNPDLIIPQELALDLTQEAEVRV
ncbi:hypothetical protein PCH_Pc13g07940 [Penicillium rubens Wisconsin 54-1255]|uniref:Uncharacterized protein n=1 Tax=Penicillium rubens (strain ATCC 28089 / DSM 1075 / NRRL 1951 / Wisconsin 54-1255) TaxID=500485 RepID=B6H482_PENRW|nr:hypothetical protein PCH_Pc13g07940 [Penicillium rubens Wisconsin 54-1255]